MEVLILTVLLGGILFAKALRFNPFDHMVHNLKYIGDAPWAQKYINDNTGVNSQWLWKPAPDVKMSVINDGYGHKNAPYEIYFYGDDVDGHLTKNDIKHIMFNWQYHKNRLGKRREC